MRDEQATCEHDLYITCKKCDYSEDVKAVTTSEEVRCIHQECKDLAAKAREIVEQIQVTRRRFPMNSEKLMELIGPVLKAERKAGRDEKYKCCDRGNFLEPHDCQKGHECYVEGYRRGLEEAAEMVLAMPNFELNQFVAERIRRLGEKS